MFKLLIFSVFVIMPISSGCDTTGNGPGQKDTDFAADVSNTGETSNDTFVVCNATIDLVDLGNGQSYTATVTGYPGFDFVTDFTSQATGTIEKQLFRASVAAPCEAIDLRELYFNLVATIPINGIAPEVEVRINDLLVGQMRNSLVGYAEMRYEMLLDWQTGGLSFPRMTHFGGETNFSLICGNCGTVFTEPVAITVCLNEVVWKNLLFDSNDSQLYATKASTANCQTTQF